MNHHLRKQRNEAISTELRVVRDIAHLCDVAHRHKLLLCPIHIRNKSGLSRNGLNCVENQERQDRRTSYQIESTTLQFSSLH